MLRNGNFDALKEKTLKQFVDRLAEQPLLFQPGSFYKYGFNTDVAGRIIEVISGVSLNEYLEKNIFQLCGMLDTGYSVPSAKAHRFSDLFVDKSALAVVKYGNKAKKKNQKGIKNITKSDGGALPGGQFNDTYRPNRHFSGGSGLAGTDPDRSGGTDRAGGGRG